MSASVHGRTDLGKGSLRKAMPTADFISALMDALERKYPTATRKTGNNRIRYNDIARILRQFGEFLKDRRTVNPDEEMLNQFSDHLVDGHKKTKRNADVDMSRIRMLVNCLPKKDRRRVLLSNKEYRKATRYDHLTPRSRKALEDFLKNGRQLRAKSTFEAPVLSNRLYSEKNRKNVVERTMRLLRVVGKDDLLSVTEKDAEAFVKIYEQEDARQRALNDLCHMRPLFANLLADGLIQSNPLKQYTENIVNVNEDYVPQEGIAILRDLSSVDWLDLFDVQARLLTYGLLYDFAMRIGETCGLLVDDVTINGFVELRVRGEIQKTQVR